MPIELKEKIDIPKIQFHHPRYNLPGKASLYSNYETRFTIQFARAYLKQFTSIHNKTSKTHVSIAREIPINGFGIADIVAIAWDNGILNDPNPTIRAFEIKINNWRKAMMQASRYSFFAHASIMVLPSNKCHLPLAYIDTLKKINVGLWGFNPETNIITTYYTPIPKIPKSDKCMQRAIELVTKVSKSLQI